MPHRCPDKERFWRGMVARFLAQRSTARDFCRRQRLAESAFYFWRCELSRRDAAAAIKSPETAPIVAEAKPLFQSVAIVPAARDGGDTEPRTKADAGANGGTAIDLRLADGHVLRVRPGFDAGTLQRLLQVLAAPTQGTSQRDQPQGKPPC